MQADRFRYWLESRGMVPGTVSSRISNCRKVERYEGDLDEHYESDGCSDLLVRMTPRQDGTAPCAIPFERGADVKNGLATLRSAVNLYVAFCSERSVGASPIGARHRAPSVPAPRVSAVRIGGASERPGPAPASRPRPLMAPSGIALTKLWLDYMRSLDTITTAIGRSSNVVGEFAEEIVAAMYGGELLPPSSTSADVELPDGRRIQVKARVPRQTATTSLGIIRSWDFDLLVVVLFNTDGSLLRAVELGVEDARRLARANGYQNGSVIVTTQAFFDDEGVRDITTELRDVMGH